ncbi:MAG: hypothetical protein HOP13_20515 [Alphaproteobacteria bacterium]|nr:hypothetical protein [Alphaproteobacteria bacterium]
MAETPAIRDITPIHCFNATGDCYEYDWLFLRASVLFILVAGGFAARRWSETLVVAVIGVIATYVMWQARFYGLVGELSNEPFMSPMHLGMFALYFAGCLFISSVAYFLKRLLLTLWTRTVGANDQ